MSDQCKKSLVTHLYCCFSYWSIWHFFFLPFLPTSPHMFSKY
nr:MAG TPA: hypothetical protein [Caudoviricetes sp.]